MNPTDTPVERKKPDLHLLGIFHTIHDQSYSHCAFTGKAMRFSKMMQPYGYRVIEYANEGSTSEAVEKVAILNRNEFEKLNQKKTKESFVGDQAVTGTEMHSIFSNKLKEEISARIKPGDIVCHPFGQSHEDLLSLLCGNRHVETGIGYPYVMEKSFKIFETQAWRHYLMGMSKRSWNNYEWIIPNYFDLEDWEVNPNPGKYVAFLGRICDAKGLDTVLEIARRIKYKVVLCGQGDPSRWMKHKNMIYRGPLVGTERSKFLGEAICTIMPTGYVEPFGGSGVEGMLCGTPLVACAAGAFTETIEQGVNGFRCQTLRQWLDAIEDCKSLSRETIAEKARARYSLEACGALYDKAFSMLSDLDYGGWYKDCEFPPEEEKEEKEKEKEEENEQQVSIID